jgi:7-keto-8-aminopelargonate synthetase-like enzyme
MPAPPLARRVAAIEPLPPPKGTDSGRVHAFARAVRVRGQTAPVRGSGALAVHSGTDGTVGSVRKEPRMWTTELAPHWPVGQMREQDLYFYLEAVEEYLPGCRVTVAGHGPMLLLGGYSYLGLNGHPEIAEAAHRAIERYGTSTTRASWTGASCRGRGSSASATTTWGHLERCLRNSAGRGRALVVVDTVFSMDGDIANLPDVSRLCRRHGAALMVDEAHAVGVLGATGHGIEEHFGLPPDSVDVKMGTFSKAIPSAGGYVAGSRELCDFLCHQARGFVYSGALAPPSAAAALAALRVIEREPERVGRLHDNARYFAVRLRESGFSFLDGRTAIFPIICGDNWRAWRLARACQRRGVYVQAIPHPVVPRGTARLRAAVTAAHRPEDLDVCVSALRAAAAEVGGIVAQASAA